MSKIYYERPQHLGNKEENKENGINNRMQPNEEYYQPSYQPQDYSEQETITPVKHGIKEWIANGILIVLSIGLVINICIAISVIGDMNYSYAKKEDNFWYNIEEGRYAGLIINTWINRFSDVEETEGFKQCYAVAEYFEAASLYKVAVYTGNAEKKEKYAKIMEEKLDYFYDIMYIAEDINEKLGIE